MLHKDKKEKSACTVLLLCSGLLVKPSGHFFSYLLTEAGVLGFNPTMVYLEVTENCNAALNNKISHNCKDQLKFQLQLC